MTVVYIQWLKGTGLKVVCDDFSGSARQKWWRLSAGKNAAAHIQKCNGSIVVANADNSGEK